MHELKVHRRHCHPDNMHAIVNLCDNFHSATCSMHVGEEALRGSFRSVVLKPKRDCMNVIQLLDCCKDGLQRVLQHCIDYGENIKAMCTVKILMHKINFATGKVEKEDFTYVSIKARPIQTRAEIHDFLDYVQTKVDSHIEKFKSKGSFWVVGGIKEILVKLVRYRLFKGGAERFHMPLQLAAKATLNIDTTNELYCFQYAILASWGDR